MGLSVGGNVIFSAGSGGGSPTSLEDLSDVDIINPQTGQYLRYNAGILEWQNAFINPDVFTYLSASLIGINGLIVAPNIGTQSFTIGLTTTGAAPGTYNNLTIDSYGRVLSGSNAAYLLNNQTITLTGDVTGSGNTNISTSLKNSGVTAGSYTKVTVDAKGLVLAGTSPTTLAGYGIVDAQPLNAELTALAAQTGTGLLTRTGTATYSERTITGTAGRVTVTNGSGFAGNPSIDLASVGSTGSYNNVTVDTYGRVTTGSNAPYLTGNQNITIFGDANGTGATNISLTLANTTVVAGSYTLANITVDSKGRIISASDGTAGGVGTVTSVSVITANGVSGLVAMPTTDPQITLTLGDITPTSVSTTGTITSGSDLQVTTGNLNVNAGNITTSGTITGSNLSGANTGDQTITLTGDVAGTGTGSFATTLATVNSDIGTFNNLTVNAKGLVTSASNVGYITGNETITVSGDVSGSGTTALPLTLATVNSDIGTFNNLTVNGKGLITGATNVGYITGNETITVSGDISGSGTTALPLTLSTVNSDIGTFNNLTVNAKGLVTSASNLAYIATGDNATLTSLELANGTQLIPSLRFTNFTDVGLYAPAANTMGVSLDSGYSLVFSRITTPLNSPKIQIQPEQASAASKQLFLIGGTTTDIARPGGNVRISGGSSTSQTGGAAVVLGGDGATGSGGVIISGGASSGDGSTSLGGNILVSGGYSSPTTYGQGGDVQISGGNTAGTSGSGTIPGSITIQSGRNADLSEYGQIVLGTIGGNELVISQYGNIQSSAAIVTFNNSLLRNITTPLIESDVASKGYVDQNTWKTAVLVATTSNITLSGLQTIDGVSVISQNRILVKNQTTTTENGIYIVQSGAWIRSEDSDQGYKLDGAVVYVRQGTVNADTAWSVTSNTVTINIDPVIFAQFGAGGGGGTVSSVSVVPANGVSGSVSTATTTPAITLTLGAITPTSASLTSGNLTFSTTGQRIIGDFTNATLASRTLFQTSTLNNTSSVGVIPNGSSSNANFTVFNNSTPTNSCSLVLGASSTSVDINSVVRGAGTLLPMTLTVGGTTALTIDTASANVSIANNLNAANNFNMTGTSKRITGDFSTNGSTTIGNRLAFQSSTTNGQTLINAFPNGTSVGSAWNVFNSSDSLNHARGSINIDSTKVQVLSTTLGTGTLLPLELSVNGNASLTIDVNSNTIISGNLTLPNSGKVISAIFTGATPNTRTYFQSSFTNGQTFLTAIPNGTAVISGFTATNSSTSAYGHGTFAANTTSIDINSAQSGGGTILPITLSVNGTVRQTFDTNGNAGFGVTPDTSSRIQSSNGIKLGNTANSNSLVLDWYEEGTWTPVVTGASTAGTGTYSSQIGTFTRIGNEIKFQVTIGWSAHTGTGTLRISLPYSPASTIGWNYPLSIYANGWAAGSDTTFQPYISGSLNGAFICVGKLVGSTGVNTDATVPGSVTRLNISGSYVPISF